MRLVDALELKRSIACSSILEDGKMLEQIIDEQPTIEERKWIPCSERLPEEDGQYLVTEKGFFGDYLYVSIANYGVPMMPMNKGKGRGWYIMDSEGEYYCDMNRVLAWMPLPKPYKERKEDD